MSILNISAGALYTSIYIHRTCILSCPIYLYPIISIYYLWVNNILQTAVLLLWCCSLLLREKLQCRVNNRRWRHRSLYLTCNWRLQLSSVMVPDVGVPSSWLI